MTAIATTTRLSKGELHQLRLEELDAIAQTVSGLDDAEWDHDTYCAGWRARDVVAHMLVGYTTPMPRMLAKVAGARFDIPALSARESVAYGTAHEPAELLAELRRVQAGDVRKGIAHLIPPDEAVVDHVIHHVDIARPLGRPRTTLPRARRVALDRIVTLGGFVKAKGRAKGLRFVATDDDWSWGDGPEVAGPSEDLLLALSGRPVGLDALDGDGVPVLRVRIG